MIDLLVEFWNHMRSLPNFWGFVTIPVVAAVVTWAHVWFAMKMVFYPLEFVGIWKPWLGWQGIVPRKATARAVSRERQFAMRAALAAYNQDLEREGLPPLRFGVGIHRGPTIAGVIGSPELMEFTVIGSTVNVASRVERLTRAHDADILVTEAVRAAEGSKYFFPSTDPIRFRRGCRECRNTIATTATPAAVAQVPLVFVMTNCTVLAVSP